MRANGICHDPSETFKSIIFFSYYEMDSFKKKLN